MRRKGDFLTVGQNTQCALLPSGLSLEASWGHEQDGAALPDWEVVRGWPCHSSGSRRAFVRGPHCEHSTHGLGLGWGWCCYMWPVRAEVQRPWPLLPHWHHLPWGDAPPNWSGGLCSHTGKCSFPPSTWQMFQLKSFKWMEANWRRAERSACCQAVICPYSAMTYKEKICFPAWNLLLSTTDDAKSSRTSLHRFCLTSSNCFWEDAEMQRLKRNCKTKRLARHEILIGDDKG